MIHDELKPGMIVRGRLRERARKITLLETSYLYYVRRDHDWQPFGTYEIRCRIDSFRKWGDKVVSE